MSTRHRSRPRRLRGAAGAALAVTLAGSLGLVSSVAAQPPPAVTMLSAEQARRTGRAISTATLTVAGQRLVTVSAAQNPGRSLSAGGDDPGDPERIRRQAMRLLDVSDDGTLALADAIEEQDGGLSLADSSGAQLTVSLPGVAGARFAPAGGWLAVVDGTGRAWRVERETGTATSLADGPFAGILGFRRDGALLLVALPSVEAPFTASLVELDPGSGRVRTLDGADSVGLVLAAAELPDGAIGLVAHRPGEGVAYLRLAAGALSEMAGLAPDAVDVSISADGSAVAYALADGHAFLVRPEAHTAVDLGTGALPRVAGDGHAVAVVRDGQTAVVDEAGRELQRVAALLVAWEPGGSCEGCGS
jgi:hypothetical protein